MSNIVEVENHDDVGDIGLLILGDDVQINNLMSYSNDIHIQIGDGTNQATDTKIDGVVSLPSGKTGVKFVDDGGNSRIKLQGFFSGSAIVTSGTKATSTMLDILNQLYVFPVGFTAQFNPSSTKAGLNVGDMGGSTNPSTTNHGDFWARTEGIAMKNVGVIEFICGLTSNQTLVNKTADKMIHKSYTDATRGSAGTAGRIIFNTDDGQINIDDGTNWTLPDGTTT